MVALWAGETPGRRHHRAFPHHQRGPAPHQPQPALHGGHHHRRLHLSARAVCPPGPPPLPDLRQRRARPPSTRPAAEWASDAGADDDGRSRRNLPLPALRRARCSQLSMGHFSFNKPDGACPTCTGLGNVQQADLSRLVDEHKSIPEGAVLRLEPRSHQLLQRHPAGRRGPLRVRLRLCRCRSRTTPPPQRDLLFFGVDSPRFRRHFPTHRAADHRPPGPLRGHRHQSAAPLRRTHPAAQPGGRLPRQAGRIPGHPDLPRLRRHAPAPGKPGRDRRRADHRRTLAPAAQRSRRLAGAASPPCSARMKCSSPARSWSDLQRAHRAAGRSRRRLPDPGTRLADPLCRGGAAPAPGVVARLGAERRALRVRRADHRAAPARHPPPDRRLAPPARPGQHGPRHRTRPGNDRRRRLRDRLRPRRRQARRAGGRRRHAGGSGRAARVAHRRLPGRAGRPSRSRRAAARPAARP